MQPRTREARAGTGVKAVVAGRILLDLVIAARDEQVRSLVDGLRASAPDETTPPS